MSETRSTAEIGKAFVAAFAEIHHAVKNADNPHFKSTFANLAQVLDVIRPVFAKHGLGITQLPGALRFEQGFVLVSIATTIIHSSGEMIGSTLEMPVVVDKNGKVTAHAVGSAISFGRRYALAAAVGITQVDDDGNAASDGEEEAESEDPVAEIQALIAAAGTLDALTAIKALVEESGDAGLVAQYQARRKNLKAVKS
jgi:hypothetical protein